MRRELIRLALEKATEAPLVELDGLPCATAVLDDAVLHQPKATREDVKRAAAAWALRRTGLPFCASDVEEVSKNVRARIAVT